MVLCASDIRRRRRSDPERWTFDDSVAVMRNLHSHHSVDQSVSQLLDRMESQQSARIHWCAFCKFSKQKKTFWNSIWMLIYGMCIQYTNPKQRLTRLFNHTINRNSAASPGFTAGFAVPLNDWNNNWKWCKRCELPWIYLHIKPS